MPRARHLSRYLPTTTMFDSYTSGKKQYPILNIDVNTVLRGTVEGVTATGPGKWGQQIGLTLEDVELVHGILMENVDRTPDQSPKFKFWSWESFGHDSNEGGFSADDAPESYIHQHSQGVTNYELVAARVGSGTPGDDEGADPEEAPSVGDFIYFESGGEKPGAAAKSLANVMTNLGGEAILDKNDIFNWIDRGVSVRPDAKGQRVEYAKVEKQGDEYTFHNPVVITLPDLTRYGQYTPAGGQEEAPATPKAAPAAPVAAAAGGAVEVEGEGTEPMPSAVEDGPVADFVNTMRDLKQTDADVIGQQLTSLVSSGVSELTEELVEEYGGSDAIVDAVTA